MYTFNEYVITKLDNSILTRMTNMCDAIQNLLGMPTVIAGLHSGFKSAVSGIEKKIVDITPRCVLTYNSLSLDKQACTSVQTVAPMVGANAEGNVGEIALPYRRLPLNVQFSYTIVYDEPALAIRLTEYLMMLAFQMPVVAGDEHTKTTLSFGDISNIETVPDKNCYNITGNLTANMQIIEPMATAEEGELYKLNGVGVQMPDGSWNETPYGQLIVDEDGKPILDENGHEQYGDFVGDGWYRLHINYHVHAHSIFDTCDEPKAATDFIKPAGSEH